MAKNDGPSRTVRQATDEPILKIFNQQFAQTKGSPVQGELSRLAVTEGLVLTIFWIEPTPSSFSYKNATSPCTGEAQN